MTGDALQVAASYGRVVAGLEGMRRVLEGFREELRSIDAHPLDADHGAACEFAEAACDLIDDGLPRVRSLWGAGEPWDAFREALRLLETVDELNARVPRAGHA